MSARKVKRSAAAVAGAALTLGVFAGFTAQPASAVSTETIYKNGRGTVTIIVNDRATTQYSVKLTPGRSYPMYGSTIYGWVPSHCELQYKRASGWTPIASALGRTGFWHTLPRGPYVTLGTYCR